MIPLYDVTTETGGLQVIPDTNTDEIQHYLQKHYPKAAESKSDWLKLRKKDSLQGMGTLVECKAGDMILWDSRTIHGGLIGTGIMDSNQ